MISVVICTRNRSEMLIALLRSLQKPLATIKHEIIIVDDCSDDNTQLQVKKKFPHAKFFRNNKRKYLIRSRNFGWKKAEGQVIFFIDDDNEIKDNKFFSHALELIKEYPEIGVVGCRTNYFDSPNTVLIGQNKFNKLTGKTTFFQMNKKDDKGLLGPLFTHDNPNAFFVKKSILEKTHGFSEEIVQTFSEADLSEKVRAIGLQVAQFPELKVYHKSPKVDFSKMSARLMGGSPERFYYLMRNRFLFIKKYATLLDKTAFSLIFSHLYSAYYFGNLIRLREWKMLLSGLRGVRDGYIYMITNRLPNFYK